MNNEQTLIQLAQKIREDVKEIEQHPFFKPYLGFKSCIVPSPTMGGNIPIPKKLTVTGTK